MVAGRDGRVRCGTVGRVDVAVGGCQETISREYVTELDGRNRCGTIGRGVVAEKNRGGVTARVTNAVGVGPGPTRNDRSGRCGGTAGRKCVAEKNRVDGARKGDGRNRCGTVGRGAVAEKNRGGVPGRATNAVGVVGRFLSWTGLKEGFVPVFAEVCRPGFVGGAMRTARQRVRVAPTAWSRSSGRGRCCAGRRCVP